MGKRSRKRRRGVARHDRRRPAAQPTGRVPSTGWPVDRRGSGALGRPDHGAPPPPWGSFPLVELAVTAAIVLGIAGFVVAGNRGEILLIGAVLIGSAAGLEVAVREHLGGYRSHTVLLSGTVAIAVLASNIVFALDRTVIVAVALATFALAFAGWRTLFKRRSGGVGVKLR